MKSVAVVTDSTADLDAATRAQWEIDVVPLTLTIDGTSMPDGSIPMTEFFERMRVSAALPTTSQPSVGAFVDVYRAALERVQHVVSVNISSKLSGTLSSACQAAEEFAGRVHVVDSLNLSWGLGLQVVEAARAAAQGASVEAVIDTVQRARDRVQLVVGLDSLDNLVRGGRISRVAGKVGGLLDVKAIIAAKDGELVLVRPVRGLRNALNHTMTWIDQRMAGATRGAFCVMHALSEERAEWLRAAILERFEPSELHMVETGTVIATHTGTGWGVAFLPEE